MYRTVSGWRTGSGCGSYFRKNLNCRTFQPNDAHKKLAEMEQKGKLDGIVTQNIDGLHQKAGSKKVWEIHGSAAG